MSAISKQPLRERVLAFDLIRGLFLVLIIINHMAASYGPSLLQLFTGASRLPASAAEGFFLISGIMVGYVYGPKILTKTKETFKKLWKRAGLLWLLCVFFTLFYTAITLHFPDSEKFVTLYNRDGISFLYNTFLLRYSFGWTDFLSRYAWFMALAPFVLLLIAKRLHWLAALVSIGIWVFFRSTEQLLPFSAWQIIFVTGIFIGYYFPAIENFFTELPKRTRTILAHTVVWLSVITITISILGYVTVPWIATHYTLPGITESPIGIVTAPIVTTLADYIDKATLDPLRLAIGTLWFTAIFILFRRYENNINKGTRGVLEVLGKNSLFVYCLHAFLLFIIDILLRPVGGSDRIIVNTLLAIVVVIVVYSITVNRRRIRSYRL